jgi:hypothetical protein
MIMRRFPFAGVAGMLAGVVGAVALLSSATPGVKVAPARFVAGSPSHPQGVKLAMTLGWQGLSPDKQPMVTKVDVWFPSGTRYNGARYPKCSLRVLGAAGPKGCPKTSIMGSGTGSAFADTVVTHPKITVVNGGASAVYFYTVLNNPARVQTPVIGHITRLRGRFAYHLSATIPPILRVVAGVPIKLTELQISAGRGTWLATTAPPAGIKIVTTFSTGARISSLALVSDV